MDLPGFQPSGPALSRDEFRELDRRAVEEFGVPALVLMENAGRGAAAWLLGQSDRPRRVVVACGAGNNGGDGGVVARHLDLAGVEVHVAWFSNRASLSPEADVQHEILVRSGLDQDSFEDERDMARFSALLSGADWVVDGLFGTGLSREVGGVYRQAIEAMNGGGAPVLALDVPSGLDCETGLPLGVAVRARATVTFVALKRGFLKPSAREYVGACEVVSIGAPRCLLEAFGIVGRALDTEGPERG